MVEGEREGGRERDMVDRGGGLRRRREVVGSGGGGGGGGVGEEGREREVVCQVSL